MWLFYSCKPICLCGMMHGHGNNFYICLHTAKLTNNACCMFRTFSFIVNFCLFNLWVPELRAQCTLQMTVDWNGCHVICPWLSDILLTASHCMLTKVSSVTRELKNGVRFFTCFGIGCERVVSIPALCYWEPRFDFQSRGQVSWHCQRKHHYSTTFMCLEYEIFFC